MPKLYPNLDNLNYVDDRRLSTVQQSNCGQIFTKGTTLTKGILEKFEGVEIGPKKASLCGRKFNTRQLWVLAGLCLLFLTSCLGISLMFGTTTFDSYVLSNLILSNTSASYYIWKGPAVKSYLKVHIFNYTNVEQYEKGIDGKLRVNEVGPFYYEEYLEKVNVKFHPNGTVSYQEKRTQHYRQDLSNGLQKNVTVVVPNIPLFGAAAMGKESFYVARVTMSTVLKGLFSKPFLDIEVDDYLWGYNDAVYIIAKQLLKFNRNSPPFDKVGMFIQRRGISKQVLNMHTGVTDINKVQQLDNFNGKNHTTHWAAKECNAIRGGDGSAFPPFDVRTKQTVYVYNKEMCRSLPLLYQQDVKIFNGKINGLKYVLPTDAFDVKSNQENRCYCNPEDKECSPKGVFNTAPCAYNTPIFVSFPHFYNADPAVREAVEGLREDIPHENYVIIHPTLGFTMSGRNRIQLNVQVQKSYGMEQMDMFHDDIILPIAWVDMGVDEMDLPESIKDKIYLTSLTVPAIEMCFKYGNILAAVVTFTAILIILRSKWIKEQNKIKSREHNLI
ncbi:hypothetical protein FQA39_LY14820 [Lamprigera yunnana]|nr:hypothetical protein FQA39_LY14820 [Lamprigera yunnana]